LVSSALGQPGREEIIRVISLPLNVDLRPQPQLVTTDTDQRVMAYVVFITSWAEYDLTFQRIDIEDANSGAVLVSYDRKDLEKGARLRATRYIESEASPKNRVLPAGRTAILYVILPVSAGSAAPKALRHRFTFEPDAKLRIVRDDGSLTTDLVAVSEPVPVNQAAVPVLGPPLEGGPWRCGNGLALGNGHTSLYSFRTAQMRVPQLFGCDFLKVDPKGDILPSPFPDQITASMFYGYGAKVLAVAGGKVVVAQDGIPESTPQVSGEVSMPVPLTNATIAGNWIALDIGGGRYAFYAHFQPGSLRVKVGDRVRAGQVLGLVGMAGNAVNPHLHFHVGNAPSLNGSDGVPYVFQDYIFEGRSVPDKTAARRVERRVPVANSLLTFPSAKP
jgi:peptidase M23-like protein